MVAGQRFAADQHHYAAGIARKIHGSLSRLNLLRQ